VFTFSKPQEAWGNWAWADQKQKTNSALRSKHTPACRNTVHSSVWQQRQMYCICDNINLEGQCGHVWVDYGKCIKANQIPNINYRCVIGFFSYFFKEEQEKINNTHLTQYLKWAIFQTVAASPNNTAVSLIKTAWKITQLVTQPSKSPWWHMWEANPTQQDPTPQLIGRKGSFGNQTSQGTSACSLLISWLVSSVLVGKEDILKIRQVFIVLWLKGVKP